MTTHGFDLKLTRTWVALLTAALTCLCAYQMYYYTLGCISMGEKYITHKQFAMQVLTIAPGFALGVHTVKKQLNPEVATHRFYKYVSIFYGIVGFLELAFFIKAGMPTTFHQNSAVTTSAFRKAAHWWIYYYAVLVVTPSQIISLIYVLTPKGEVDSKSDVVQAEAQLIKDISDELQEPVLLEKAAHDML